MSIFIIVFPFLIFPYDRAIYFMSVSSPTKIAGFGEVGVAEEDLEFFFEERVELDELFDHRNDVERIF